MLRVLFDKNVPYLLRRHLIDYQVQTADDEGWGQISNGELISCAEEAGYQIMIMRRGLHKSGRGDPTNFPAAPIPFP